MTAPIAPIDFLADLRVHYTKRLNKRVETLAAFVQDCRQGTVNDEAISEQHRCVHNMIGSAAIFGHPELSESALVAERAFLQRRRGEIEPIAEQIEQLLAKAHHVLSKNAASPATP